MFRDVEVLFIYLYYCNLHLFSCTDPSKLGLRPDDDDDTVFLCFAHMNVPVHPMNSISL